MRDGLIFIGLGYTLFTIGIMTINIAFIGLLPIAIFLNSFGIRLLQEKFTYPRLGRVQPHREEKNKKILLFTSVSFGVIGVVITLILLFFSGIEGIELWFNLLPLVLSLVLGLQSIDFGRKTGNTLFYLVTFFFLFSGFIFAFLDLNIGIEKLAIFSFLWGIILLLGGFVIFFRFLSKYPELKVEEKQIFEEES